MPALSKRRWILCGGLASAAAAALWLATQHAAPTRVPPVPPETIHVAEVVPTDPRFREPVRAFGRRSAYWRVVIRDAREHAVTGARVHVDVVGPDGGIRARLVERTGTDGLALFTYPLETRESEGVWTVRVVNVSHAGGGAAYDPTANDASTTSFSVLDRTHWP
jgi:hypothetical protein